MNIEIAPHSEKPMTYNEAVLYCAFCRHNGHSDWRLPTRDEYESDLYIGFAGWYLDDSKSGYSWYVILVYYDR